MMNKNEWKKVKLGDIFDLQMGKTPSRNNKNYWENGTNSWISISDIKENEKYIEKTKEKITDIAIQESKIKCIPKNTVIMSFKLSVGKTAITSQDIYTNEAIVSFIPKNLNIIDNNYLYYSLPKIDWSKGINKAVKGLTLNKPLISNKIISFPDLHTQKQIAEKLDLLSYILNLKKEQLFELDKLVKFQFLKMFGDPILNERNWENVVWKNILIIKNGKNQKQVENIQGIYPIYGSGGIIGYANEYLCEKDTVIIGRKGNINKPILVKTKFWNVDTAFGLEPIKKVLSSYFLYYFCIFYNFEKHNKAVTIPSLTKNDLLEIKMPLPPIELQNKFAEFVKQVDKSKVNNFFDFKKAVA